MKPKIKKSKVKWPKIIVTPVEGVNGLYTIEYESKPPQLSLSEIREILHGPVVFENS